MYVSDKLLWLVGQELVRAMYKRPRVVDKLRANKVTRPGLPNLSSFLAWLWPLTAARQRFFRGHAMWLHKHLATLQLADAAAEGMALYTCCQYAAPGLQMYLHWAWKRLIQSFTACLFCTHCCRDPHTYILEPCSHIACHHLSGPIFVFGLQWSLTVELIGLVA